MSTKLALRGGDPVARQSFPMWPQFAEQTLSEVLEPLRSGKVNYWTGPKGMEFERRFAAWEFAGGPGYAISCTNGTAALHTAIGALGIGPGDEVIVPSYSFVASSFAVVQAGAIPVFCDVTEDHTIDPAKIEPLITGRTRAIIAVHLYGVVCDLDPIVATAARHNLKVIEDCAQAPGGRYKGRKTGTIGQAGAFSFSQSKHFTTGGEGGMVVTADEDLAWECRSFRSREYTDPEAVRYSERPCPVARSLRPQTVSLFLHPSWEPEHIQLCIRGFTKVLAAFGR